MNNERSSNELETKKSVRVPISTFPPTAVVYSLNENDTKSEEYVSAALIAKILEERENGRSNRNMNNKKSFDCSNKINNSDQLLIQMDGSYQNFNYYSNQYQLKQQTVLKESQSMLNQDETIII